MSSKERDTEMGTQKIAVTADMEMGLDSPLSGHFGHCKAFIVSTIENGKIVDIETVPNLGHSSCAEPVMRLADIGVSILITMGMGMRPYMAAQQLGLTVVKGMGSTVGDALISFINGAGTLMNRDGLCGGGSGGCSH
jgi:predicted Fe-Mo cluster-binding NifX family protein